MCKCKILSQISPWHIITFLLTYSLHNFLLESPCLVIFCYNLTGKTSKTTSWTITCSQLIIFWVSELMKTNPLLSLWSGTPILGLAKSIYYFNLLWYLIIFLFWLMFRFRNSWDESHFKRHSIKTISVTKNADCQSGELADCGQGWRKKNSQRFVFF